MVSFGTANPNSPGSTSFLQASSSAQELVQALNLDTTPGAFQKAWSQAFSTYASTSAGHWHKAQTELAQLQSTYPNFKAIAPYLSYAQEQAKNESAPSGSSPISIGSTASIPALAWTIGVLTLIAFLALVILALGFARTGKKRAAIGVAQGYAVQSNSGPSGLPMQQQANAPFVPNIPVAQQSYNNGLAAFGGPPPSVPTPVQPYPTQQSTMQQQSSQMGPAVPVDSSSVLHPWPCGHLNRSNARFCSICGEPAPPPSTSSTFVRRFEQ
ncbi:MAG: hypothetical protein NVS4B12_20670 [Ktedonobacteraceae bacterium]